MGAAACGEASVERGQRLVPAEGGRKRGGEERAAQSCTAAADVAFAFMFPAIVVEWSKTGKCCGFLAVNPTEFGHADDDRKRRALSDARHAEHEIEAAGEILVEAQLSGNPQQLGCTPLAAMRRSIMDWA